LADRDIRELVRGLDFGESPRWHEGRLWYSDFFQEAVFAVDPDGTREWIFDVPGQPSGLGWLPDGRLLVVSMLEHRVYRRERDGSLVVHADLSELAIHPNDMVVAEDGTAYVGHFGFEFYSKPVLERPPIIVGVNDNGSVITGDAFVPASVIGVTVDGHAWVAADDVAFPNGAVITADGQTLIVGESVGQQYVAFPLRADGSVQGSERRIWARLPGTSPDGCTMDADGGIWFADSLRGRVRRVVEGGTLTDEIKLPLRAYACMLGGDDGCTLFIMCAPGVGATACAGKAEGMIFATVVDSPHSGRP
jgi:sugar lactone lactonase YvrE